MRYRDDRKLVQFNPPTSGLLQPARRHDLMAVHVLDYLKTRRLRVPADMSIVGYDNAPESGETDPPG